MHEPDPARSYRFGTFVLDVHSGELRSDGRSQRVADQPLALLVALLERPGEMVTREELRHRLWPEGTFVDFDHGLNSAISRLREALNDSADAPRVVETIPRRGYRLLVPVESLSSTPPAVRKPPTMPVKAAAWAAAGLIVLAVFVVTWRRGVTGPAPLLANVVIDLPEGWAILNQRPAISPDSRHIAFSAWHSDGRRAIWLRRLDASAARLLHHTEDGSGPFWSPDGSTIGFFAEGKLKALPIDGGSARVVCDASTDSNGTWVSPDVVLFAPGPTGAVYEVALARGALRPITRLEGSAGERRHLRPTALPDGVAGATSTNASRNGEGPDELVFESPINKTVQAWSPDGRHVVYDTGGSSGGTPDLHVLSLAGDHRQRVLSSAAGFQDQADISPDGRLVAYASSESGRYEVIVESFPDKGGQWQVSTAGGKEPLWRADGRELFFLSDSTLMAVDVHPGRAGFEWGAPRALFTLSNLQTGAGSKLSVSSDGQRFIAVISTAPNERQRLTTVLNWTSLLK